MKVLLIDDTPEIAELLTFGLRDHGFDVVSSGFTAGINDLIAAERPDALVFDCSVLEMSESLLDTVRGDEAHAALPIVMISDRPEQADARLAARDAKRVLLIPKPFAASHVARALNQLLSNPHPSPNPNPNPQSPIPNP